MPIYEYVCTSCGSEFEAIQKFSDAPLSECACGESGTVERKLSLAAFQLKGGGWYKDQYGAKANGNGNGKSASSGDTAKSGDAAKSTGSGDTAKSGDAAKSDSSGDAAKSDSGSSSGTDSSAPAAAASG